MTQRFMHFLTVSLVLSEETDLGVSFNTRSQTSDIRDISTRIVFSFSIYIFLEGPIQGPGYLFPVGVRVYGRALGFLQRSSSQVHDDPSYVQNPQCVPCDRFSSAPPLSQVISRLIIRLSTEPCQVPFDFPSSAHQILKRTTPQTHRLIHERSFIIIRGRFYRLMIW